MPSARATGQDFLRLLQAIDQPLYMVDAQRRIVFLNEACAQWLGLPATDLIGRTCRYQSGDADPLAAAADRLCPPPEALQGVRTVAAVSGPEGGAARRRAEFIQLRGDDETAGVLSILDPEDLASADIADGREGDIAAADDEPRQLHELVLRLRQEMTKWHHLDRLAGTSPAMVRVRAQVKLAAAGSGTVLVVGPPGIGRQHVARAIHAAAGECGGPDGNQQAFLPVACSTLPADLLRSTIAELNARPGQAAGEPATVLLVDADRLPDEVQADVSQWLSGIKPHLRVMATAIEPLDALARRGEFRADLAQLLSTLVIELPALAMRRDDIPLLAQMVLEDVNAQSERQLRGFTTQAMDRLVEYDWPGQIDELSSVVREACAQAEGFEVAAAALPKRIGRAAEAARYARQPAEPIDLEKFLAQVETELVSRALRDARGNKTLAARLLGLTRPRLYRRMVQLGLERDAADGEES